MRTVAATVLLFLTVVACGEDRNGAVDTTPGATQGTDQTPTSPSVTLDRPPDLVVTAGGERLILSPFTYCWSVAGQGICADGAPPDPLPSLTLETGSRLTVEFPLDWRIRATLLSDGDYCSGALTFDVDPNGAPLEVLGPGGTYRVDLFARGEQGDGAWAFELTTTEDRPSPPGHVQVLWYPGGQELEADALFHAQVGNLTEKPNEVSAEATITSSSGRSGQFDLIGQIDDSCWSSVVGLQGPGDLSARALELGPPPYDVVISVTLDDRDITWPLLTWPDDFPPDGNESRRVPIEVEG